MHVELWIQSGELIFANGWVAEMAPMGGSITTYEVNTGRQIKCERCVSPTVFLHVGFIDDVML